MISKYMKKFGALILGFGLVVAGSTIASATTATGDFKATCDPTEFGFASDGSYHYHDNSNVLVSVTNNDSGRTATVRLYRSTGTTLSSYNIANTSTKIWGSAIAAGYYRVEAKAASTANCNGALPGNGNFTFKYLISY